MTLAESLEPRLSNWTPTARETWEEAFADAGWTVGLTADHNGVVGTRAWELTLARTGETPAGLTTQAWAEKIAARSSGLLERIKLLEVDAVRDEAILRSDTPSKKGDVVSYYEIILHGTNKAAVRRYSADRKAGTKREQVAFAVTHETLMKLVNDITG
ncbi:hypothetical protein [Limnoglobus roseus]|uniref:Uncharacterized protein n=1 Tax=Limnoglobus roseus TaxID=2598579 RepID=A0A5C1ABS4_9BACT|nr:hypothetical protein [Limnoglobus roseus]QEL16035.1 hypothetical protein PX52LOC_02973 [Limnoglobus roseus]